MKINIPKILLFIFVSSLYSLDIYGTVSDKNSKQPLPMANIYIDEISAVTKSDTSGNFLFKNIKNGTYTIGASYIGYEKFNEKHLLSNSNLYIEIDLIKSNNEENSFSISEKKINTSLVNEPKNVSDINSLFAFNFNDLTGSPGFGYSLGAQVRYGDRQYLGFLKSDDSINIFVCFGGAGLSFGLNNENENIVGMYSVHSLDNFLFMPGMIINMDVKQLSVGASLVVFL